MSGMNERREVICGLSVEEAREFLAHIGEERVQHEVLHVRKGATVRQALNHISEKLDEKARRELQRARQRHQDDEMHCIRDNVRTNTWSRRSTSSCSRTWMSLTNIGARNIRRSLS
jgi:hypothetical protein